MRLSGFAIIAIALLIPMIWLPGIAQGRDVVALVSQYFGMTALIAMAIGQIIATRWPGIEQLFGPMDQSYRFHKWLGVGAMVVLLLHDTIDAEMRGLGRETALVETAETLGEISLYGLLILVVITIATFIPYHLWKWTHRLIGIFFIFGATHFLFILKPFSNGDPLGLYMLVVCALGTAAYAYTSAPRGMRRALEYEIQNVSAQGETISVDLTPMGRPLRHMAGQFGFFAFVGAGYAEPHPFTISSSPNESGDLRVTIAPLGDLTKRLQKLVGIGQRVRVDGPYGRFGGKASKPQVWIAAGVGITPFLALAGSLKSDNKPVHLVYSVKRTDQAAHVAEVEGLASANSNLTAHIWESSKSGRLTGSRIAELVGDDLSGFRVLFCGPSEMRRSLSEQLSGQGVSAKNFCYEVFEIRTGLGLRRIAEWLWSRRQKSRSHG